MIVSETGQTCKPKKILICEDSMEGIFSAVYDGWKYGDYYEVSLSIGEPWEQEFFAGYETIPADSVKFRKVIRSIWNKLGMTTWEQIGYCAVADDAEKGTAIFHTLWKALSHGQCNRDIMEELADPYVNHVFKMHTRVWHEYHRFLGFVRFREAGGGVLFSKIKPENDILEMLGPHFQNRYPLESWMIYDEKRSKVLIHPAGEDCSVRRDVHLKIEQVSKPTENDEYEQLWKAFCDSITIEARRNPKLQQQFLPRKFQTNMTEFIE